VTGVVPFWVARALTGWSPGGDQARAASPEEEKPRLADVPGRGLTERAATAGGGDRLGADTAHLGNAEISSDARNM